MTGRSQQTQRTIGLLGATGIGVGAIVGGGILALAGVAFATTGPGAVLAFALNGVIALVTALSYAEMSSAFPESGGTYTFAKKVLSVRSAFMVGWVVWFASIVAAVLYALGFAAFAGMALERIVPALFGGEAPAWVRSEQTAVFLALIATAFYSWRLVKQSGGGAQWETIGKLVVFGLILLAGVFALVRQPPSVTVSHFSPFFPGGFGGLLQAMGYTFIALQGFDLIAAVAGEVREPERVIPRAMIYSLGIALAVYLPLLLLVSAVGVEEGALVHEVAAADMEGIVATAVQRFLGPLGFWLVIIAALLSMLSALSANLMAASRVSLTMAGDRALPAILGEVDPRTGAPVLSIVATAFMVVTVLTLISNVAAAGAVASLIFLVSFALAHLTSYLARRRRDEPAPFESPMFPLVPVVGMVSCLLLAVFQGVVVPSAGIVALVWLGVGGVLFFWLFARRARVVDASAQAMDPALSILRGHTPLVLVPIANPASAAGLVTLASALAPPRVGRVLMLSVVPPPAEWTPGERPRTLVDAQAIIGESLAAAFAARLAPQALVTVAEDPWTEIARVARLHRCESLLVGMGTLDEAAIEGRLARLVDEASSDLVLLRAPPGWDPSETREVLVPVGGRRNHSTLRARLLGSLRRAGLAKIRYLGVMHPGKSDADEARLRRELRRLADDEVGPSAAVGVARGEDVIGTLVTESSKHDLVVLGVQQNRDGSRVFGEVPERVAAETDVPLLIISGSQ